MNSGSELVLMSRERILRSLHRMAHEIVEQNMGDAPVSLFGINERGYAVANSLADVLDPIANEDIRLFELPLKGELAENLFDNISLQDNHYPVIVDDVIFSGETMFNALKVISNYIKPSEIHTAVLVDRGHRKFPITAEFYGMELPTKSNEHVSVVVEKQQLQIVKLTKS